ncbi:UDP-3-O-(3-hydroxymyristoyl)glucosamine N-acyltransferase [Brevundimonas sp.]|uniref:UDP-3-O-(3-hydroxymyristoyl)glucosamine N-acyltransferase n=1 Tax=Brevundimonas sp. TaxID=1871086 RepID=UPI0025D77347|nr:UDP-3-O-(3-hydroxymyristoyl)glucosamine N-acyltransferase [Brevundimonas sp.]
MPDARFFLSGTPLTLAQLAKAGSADLVRGDPDAVIETVAPLALAGARGAAFLGDKRYRADLAATRAGAVFLAAPDADFAPAGVGLLVTPTPQAAWSAAAARLHPPRRLEPDQARHPSVELEEGVLIGPGVVIGEGVAIGARTRIGANVVIGPGVQIGRDCDIGPNVSLGFCLIGDRVRIAAGAVIGEPGFGVAGHASGLVDVVQLGRVVIQDRVSVGANSCIDRGAYGDTVVGEGTKIDNLVQVAHNVRIGRNCILAGHVGLAGSVVIGDGSALGGRAGVTDHVTIGKNCRVAAASAVSSDMPDGETWGGDPARPIKRFLRETVWLAKQARGRAGGEHG